MKNVKHTAIRTPFLDIKTSAARAPAVAAPTPFVREAPLPRTRREAPLRAVPDEEFESPSTASAMVSATLPVVGRGPEAEFENAGQDEPEPDDTLEFLDEASSGAIPDADLAALDEAWHDDHDEEWQDEAPAPSYEADEPVYGAHDEEAADVASLGDIEEGEDGDDTAQAVLEHVGLDLGDMHEPVREALRAGQHGSAVRLAIQAGVDNESRLTDMVLLARHPELLYRPPISTEFDFEERDSIFRRIFKTVDATRARIGRGIASAVAASSGQGIGGGLGALAAGAVAGAAAGAQASQQSAVRAARRRDHAVDPIRRLVCTDDDLTQIGQVVGRAVSSEHVRQGVLDVVTQAAALSRSAAEQLSRGRLRQTDVSASRTESAFRTAFGVAPSFVPSWRPKGATWNRGDVVRARLRRIARVFDSGNTSYLCWGPRHSPELNWQPHNRSYALKGKFEIHLGPGFWKDWAAGDTPSMVATMIRNQLIVHYDTIVPKHQRSHFGTAACYVRFVLEATGQKAPARSVNVCGAIER